MCFGQDKATRMPTPQPPQSAQLVDLQINLRQPEDRPQPALLAPKFVCTFLPSSFTVFISSSQTALHDSSDAYTTHTIRTDSLPSTVPPVLVMENLSLNDTPQAEANAPPPMPPPQGVPQLPPQMFTTAAQLLDLTDSMHPLLTSHVTLQHNSNTPPQKSSSSSSATAANSSASYARGTNSPTWS